MKKAINVKLNKNETKIIIIKQDSETKERLEGVEFELLDENKKVVYANLKTDKEGKIVVENLVPGKYYLKETNTLNDYDMYRDLISLNVSLNERFTVTINNNKKDIPKIEVTENELTTSNKEIKKLPVTGM